MFFKANPLIFQRARELRNKVTVAESIVWSYLRTKPLGHKFRRQHPLGIYIADFFCYKLKLVIEIDGAVHNHEDVKANDEQRQKIIESDGIQVLRFTNDEVLNSFDDVVLRIQNVLL